MGDNWDYKLKRMEFAWDLANRIIPEKVAKSGRWTQSEFLEQAQATLEKAQEVVKTVFNEAD